MSSKYHSTNWRESVNSQLQLRKSIEQTPFEEICSFAESMFDKVEIYKSENMQLILQREQLQQQILNIQQSLLAGGSEAAKPIISKLPTTNLSNENSDSATVKELKDALEKLELKHTTLTDEYLALTLSYKSLEKRYHALRLECDAMSMQILAAKREDAERLNAENDKIIRMQRERAQRELESNVATMTKEQVAKQAAGDRTSLAAINDNFETIGDEEDLRLFNVRSRIPGGIEFSFEAHEGGSTAVKWYCCSGPRDDYLATGGQDRKVKIWKISNSTTTLIGDSLQGSNSSITSIDVEADAILASSCDMATRVWSLTSQRLDLTLTGHSAKVNSAKFLGAPNRIASGSADRTIKLWDVNRGACVRTFFAASNCFDLVYGNYHIISCHFDKKIRGWDLNRLNDNDCAWKVPMGDCKVISVDISADGTKVMCCLRDNTIKCVDLRTFEVLQTYSDEKFKTGEENWRVNFSNDDQLIACGSSDGSFFIWDVNTAKVEKVLKGHNNKVLAATWSPDGKKMVSIENGKKVSIWI